MSLLKLYSGCLHRETKRQMSASCCLKRHTQIVQTQIHVLLSCWRGYSWGFFFFVLSPTCLTKIWASFLEHVYRAAYMQAGRLLWIKSGFEVSKRAGSWRLTKKQCGSSHLKVKNTQSQLASSHIWSWFSEKQRDDASQPFSVGKWRLQHLWQASLGDNHVQSVFDRWQPKTSRQPVPLLKTGVYHA